MQFQEKYFLFFLKIGRKSISTGSPGRSRPPEFKKIAKTHQNNKNRQKTNQKTIFLTVDLPLFF